MTTKPSKNLIINYKGIEIKTAIPPDVGMEIVDYLIGERLLISLVGKNEWRKKDRVNKEKQLFIKVGLAVNGKRYQIDIRGQKVEIDYVCPGKAKDKHMEILLIYPITVTSGSSGVGISLK